jgi:hypothetical protein
MKNYLGLAIKGLILFILVLSTLYLPKAILLYSGYCWEEGRYLTTQEKFDLVVMNIINEKAWRNSYTVNEVGGKIFSEEMIETFKYSSLKEFYALNPNCCEFVETLVEEGEVFTVPFRARVSGHLNIFVRAYYIYDFDKQNNNLPLYAEKYFGVSNCGELLTPREVVRLHRPEW